MIFKIFHSSDALNMWMLSLVSTCKYLFFFPFVRLVVVFDCMSDRPLLLLVECHIGCIIPHRFHTMLWSYCEGTSYLLLLTYFEESSLLAANET